MSVFYPRMSPQYDDADAIPTQMAPQAQHPMHALIAPLSPPAPEIDPMMAYEAEQAARPATKMSVEQAPAPTRMSPLDQRETELQQGMTKKPEGFWQKFGHAAGMAGRVAGDIIAPTQTELVVKGLGKEGIGPRANEFRNDEIQNIEAQKSKQALDEATTEHLAAETPQIAPNAESLRRLQGTEVAHNEAATNALQNPPEEWKAIPQVIGPNGEPVEIESRSGNVRFGSVSGLQQQKQPKPDTPEQQYIDEYQRLHKGATIADAERAYTADTQKAPQSIMLIPGPNGTYRAQDVRPGSTVAPGAISTGGLNTIDTPTSQQRNVAAQAKLVTDQMPGLISEIQKDADLIGPMMGRWNEFMQGKVGMDNPELAGLRADLLMMSSAVALMHARGRLPENLREEFDRAINAPQQTAENLVSTLNHINQWTTANINAMGGQAAPTGGANGANMPPAGAKVRDYSQVSH
jgi:hypothetical protein